MNVPPLQPSRDQIIWEMPRVLDTASVSKYLRELVTKIYFAKALKGIRTIWKLLPKPMGSNFISYQLACIDLVFSHNLNTTRSQASLDWTVSRYKYTRVLTYLYLMFFRLLLLHYCVCCILLLSKFVFHLNSFYIHFGCLIYSNTSYHITEVLSQGDFEM